MGFLNWLGYGSSNPPIKYTDLSQAGVRSAFQAWSPGMVVHMDDRAGYTVPTVEELVEWMEQDTTHIRAAIGVHGWRCFEFSLTSYQNLIEYQAKLKIEKHWTVGIMWMPKMADRDNITPQNRHAMIGGITDDGIYLIESQKRVNYRKAVPRKDKADLIFIA